MSRIRGDGSGFVPRKTVFTKKEETMQKKEEVLPLVSEGNEKINRENKKTEKQLSSYVKSAGIKREDIEKITSSESFNVIVLNADGEEKKLNAKEIKAIYKKYIGCISCK